MTLTRQETAPYVEAILDLVPSDLTPIFVGQLRLESALITKLDVVLQLEPGSGLGRGWLPPAELSEPPLSLEWEWIRNVTLGKGYIRLAHELPITFWACSGKALGSVLLHATGPQEFTIALQRKAQRKGFILHLDGLFFNMGMERLDDGSERNIFRMLDVPWMEPVDRNAFSKIDYREQEVIEREVPASKGGGTYLVRILGDKASCPCPGFQHRHQCRHLTQVREELGLPTPLRTDVLRP